MFNKGTISSLADIIFVFNFSPLIVKEVRGNRSRCSISYPPSKFWQVGRQWWHINSISDVPPIERIKGSKVR
jgi:hypothetical protein